MKKNIPNSFDDLMKNRYSSPAEDFAGPAVRFHGLLSSYYGRQFNKEGTCKKPVRAVSLSMDNGETLAQHPLSPGFEEYVVSQSIADGKFEEYLVSTTEIAAQSSVDQGVAREYTVDLFQRIPESGDVVAPQVSKGGPAASSIAPPIATEPAGAPEPAGQSAANAAKPGEDDFLADLQAILQGKKVYDPAAGKPVDKDKASQAPASTSPAGQDSSGLPVPEAKNAQAIFDKIAQSMQYANAYDLGSVEMNNRFSDFDKISDIKEKAQDKKSDASSQISDKIAENKAKTSDFLEDIAAIRSNYGASSQTAAPQETDLSSAASLPSAEGYSRPLFDTGEHAQMAGDQYKDRLHVGKAPGVAFSYGQIIALPDLYESVDQMMATDKAELETIKNLVVRSTDFYVGKKTNKALDVSNKEWDDATGGRYLKLAADNYDHFSPHRYVLNTASTGSGSSFGNHKSAWEKHHRRAIEEAQRMFLANSNAPIFPELPLIVNAFGDHFLTDAFAAGHQINKDEMTQLFKSKFYSGSSINSAAKTFFQKVAQLAFKGDVKKKFSVLETYDAAVLWWHPNIDTVHAFQTLLEKAAEQQPDVVANVAVKALHDYLNKQGIEVTNAKNEGPWTITGDAYMNQANLAIIRKAVQQSINNINDPGILASNINFDAFFAKVWNHVPVLTAASTTKIRKLMNDFSDPGSGTLQNAAADIIYNQVDALIKKLKDEKKLRDA
jgi:hypothetical protein